MLHPSDLVPGTRCTLTWPEQSDYVVKSVTVNPYQSVPGRRVVRITFEPVLGLESHAKHLAGNTWDKAHQRPNAKDDDGNCSDLVVEPWEDDLLNELPWFVKFA